MENARNVSNAGNANILWERKTGKVGQCARQMEMHFQSDVTFSRPSRRCRDSTFNDRETETGVVL